MSIEERLARLERHNRRLTALLVAVVAVAVCGSIMALNVPVGEFRIADARPAAPPEIIRANRFEVIDAEGRVLAAMAANAPGTGGVVYANNNRGALVVQRGAADDGRGVLWAYDACGQLRADAR
jgi:hypothetical protein